LFVLPNWILQFDVRIIQTVAWSDLSPCLSSKAKTKCDERVPVQTPSRSSEVRVRYAAWSFLSMLPPRADNIFAAFKKTPSSRVVRDGSAWMRSIRRLGGTDKGWFSCRRDALGQRLGIVGLNIFGLSCRRFSRTAGWRGAPHMAVGEY